jgi:hypothetical protein
MPQSCVVREEDGSVPFVDWFEKLPDHAQDKVLVRMNAFGSSATNCAGLKRISFATEFTNCAPHSTELITGCCISSTGKLPRWWHTVW